MINDIQVTVSSEEAISDTALLECEEMSRTKAAMSAAQSAVNCYISDFKQDPSGSNIYSQYDNASVKVESARVIDLSLSVSEGYNDSSASDSTSSEGTDGIDADLHDDLTISVTYDDNLKVRTTEARRTEIIYCDDNFKNPAMNEAVLADGECNVSFECSDNPGMIIVADVRIMSYGADSSKKLEATNKSLAILNHADPKDFLKAEDCTEEQLELLKPVADEAVKGCTSDYEKIKAVTEFVSKNIYYDYMYYNGYKSSTYIKPYEVWNSKITVCDGYSRLSRALLIEEGIPCIKIRGENHAYNAAYDSSSKRWVVFDATWCSYNRYTEEGKFVYGGYTLDRFDMSAAKLASLSNHEVVIEIDSLKTNNDSIVLSFTNNFYDDVERWTDYSNWTLAVGKIKAIDKNVNLGDAGSIEGIPVRKIGQFACMDNNTIETVSIPGSIKEIGPSAFYECKSLKKVDISQGVKIIENDSFSSCENLIEIEIPDSVEKIGDYAFYGCKSLKSIRIPDNIETLGDHAFFGCKSLKSIRIPDNIETLGDGILGDCTSLDTIDLPKGMKTIGKFTFEHCKNLPVINLPQNLRTIESYAFYGCVSLKELAVPERVTHIGNNAFQESGIESIVLPEGLKTISSGLFQNCYRIKSIVLPKSIQTIEVYAFVNCDRLRNVTIYENATSISENAFPYFYCTTNIIGIPGSAVEDFARSRGYTFRPICSHESVNKVEAKDATCEDEGNIAYWICTSCDRYFSSESCSNDSELDEYSLVVKRKKHSIQMVELKPSTCRKTGMKEHYECSNCHKKFLDSRGKKPVAESDLLIKKVPHKYNSKSEVANRIKTKATCTKKPTYYYSCSMCGVKGTKSFTAGSALGHSYKKYIVAAATTSKDGSYYKKCTRYGKKYAKAVIPKAGKVYLSESTVSYKDGSTESTAIADVKVRTSKNKDISKSYYSLTYNNNFATGVGKVTIAFKGDYKGR